MQKVLIIEDHADMRELLSWQIELMGFRAILAKHGKEGVEKAIAEKPELILMDIMMPGMDGWEAARAVRASPEIKDIPILAATAMFRDSDLKTCMEAVATATLSNPSPFLSFRARFESCFLRARTQSPPSRFLAPLLVSLNYG